MTSSKDIFLEWQIQQSQLTAEELAAQHDAELYDQYVNG